MMPRILMVLAAWLGAFSAVDPNTSASWVGGVAALSLLTIAIGFNIRQYRSQVRDIKQLKIEKARDKRECNWQLSVLTDVLEDNGIPMPGKFWDVPEDPILRVQEEEIKRRRRMIRFSASDKTDESGAIGMSVVGIGLLIMAFIAVLMFLANSLIIQPIQDIEASGRVDNCNNSLTADEFVSIVYALQAGPNTEQRDVYSALANEAASRIRHRLAICADGKPDTFVIPQFIPPTTTTVP